MPSPPPRFDLPLKPVGQMRTRRPSVGPGAFNPTNDQRDLVRVLAAQPNSQALIARIIGCGIKTLRQSFRDELRYGREHVDALVGAAVVRSAIQGNVAAQKFYLLTHRVKGWELPIAGTPEGDAAILAATLAETSHPDDLKPRIFIPATIEPPQAEDRGPLIDGLIEEAA